MAQPSDINAQVYAEVREHHRKNMAKLFYNKEPDALLSLLEAVTVEEGFGRSHIVKVRTTTGSAMASDITSAQTISNGSDPGNVGDTKRFEVTPVNLDVTTRWKRGEMLAAQGDPGDMYDLLTDRVERLTALAAKRIGIYAAGNGSGSLGQIIAVTTTTVTVATGTENRFQLGDRVDAAAAEFTGGVRAGGPARVISVDPNAHTVQFNVDVAALGWAVNDHLFFFGSRGLAQVPSGVFGWNPIAFIATGAGDSWFSLDRGGDINLQGHRQAAGSMDIEQTLTALVNRMWQFGQPPTHVLVSGDDWSTLSLNRDASKVVELTAGGTTIGFQSIMLSGTRGKPIPILPTNFFPQGRALAANFVDKDKRPYLPCANGELVIIDELDGNMFRPYGGGAGTTDFEMRAFYRGNISCPAPGSMGVATGLPPS